MASSEVEDNGEVLAYMASSEVEDNGEVLRLTWQVQRD